MEYTKNLQDVSKEYEIITDTCDEIAENPSQSLHFYMLWGLGACPGRPGDHPRMGTLKNTNKKFRGTLLFLEHMYDIC